MIVVIIVLFIILAVGGIVGWCIYDNTYSSTELYDGSCCDLTDDKKNHNSCMYCPKKSDGKPNYYKNIKNNIIKSGDPSLVGLFCGNSYSCGDYSKFRWTCADLITFMSKTPNYSCKSANQYGNNVNVGDKINGDEVICTSDQQQTKLKNIIYTDCLAGPSRLSYDDIIAYKYNFSKKDYDKLRIENNGTKVKSPSPFVPPKSKGICSIINI